jgi:hypothetical protein
MGEHKRKGGNMTSTKIVSPNEKHIACREAMLNAIRKAAADLPADEILAIAAHLGDSS